MSIFGATGNSLFSLGSDQGIDNTVEQAKFIINNDNKYELQLLMSDSTVKKTVLPINQTLDASSNVVFNALELFNPLDISHGGTGSKTAVGARANLGLGSLAIQSDVSVNINGGTVKGLSEFSCVSGIASSFRITNLDVSSQANIANLDTNVIESIGDSLSIGDNSGCSSITIGCGNNVQTVNIGSVNSGQTTVNIGSGSDIVNIAGSLNYIQSTNLEVNDKTITINKGSSGSGTARGSALLIRDNSIDNAGYIQVNNTGNAYELKAPENNYVLSSPVINQNETIVVSSDSRLTNARQCNNTFVDASASRNNLGLTSVATASYGTTAGSVCQGNDSRLSDARQCNGTFTDVSASRTNLGLGNMSLQNSNNVNITGGTITGVAGLGSKWSDASGGIFYNTSNISIGSNTITSQRLAIYGDTRIGFASNSPSFLLNLGHNNTALNGTRAGYIFGDASGNMSIVNQQNANLVLGTNNSTTILMTPSITEHRSNLATGYVFNSESGLYLTKGSTYGIPSIQGLTNQFGISQNICLNPVGGFVGIGTTSPNANLEIRNTATNGFVHTFRSFIPNLSAGGTGNALVFGVAPSNLNSGYIAYNYSGSNSSLNSISIGLWGVDGILSCFGNNSVAMAGPLEYYRSRSKSTYPIGTIQQTSLLALHCRVNMRTGALQAPFTTDLTATAYANGVVELVYGRRFDLNKPPVVQLSVEYPNSIFVNPIVVVNLPASCQIVITQGNGTPITSFNNIDFIMNVSITGSREETF